MLSCSVSRLPPAVLRLVRARAAIPGGGLRAWVAGDDGGLDAHLVAARLLAALGPRWRETDLRVLAVVARAADLPRVQAGLYPAAALRGLERGVRERCFSDGPGVHRARPFLRECCRFLVADPSRPAPFAGVDLVWWRGARRAPGPRELAAFHAALRPGGLLLSGVPLGAPARELFAPVKGARSCYAARPGRCALGARIRAGDGAFSGALFARSREAILVRDVESDAIIEANEAAARVYGWSVEELLGLRGADLCAPAGASRRAAGERRSEARLTLPHHRRKDGSLFPIEATSVELTLRGRLLSLLTVRDATESLKAAALRAGRRREEAQEAFMDEIVHELRNPMAVIAGSAELLREGVDHPGARARLLRSIEAQTSRMSVLVERLLHLGGARSPQRAPSPSTVALAPLVTELVWSFEPLAKRRGISVQVDVTPGLEARADADDLVHILRNLLDNAVKYNRSHGRVVVSGRAEGAEAVLSVRDTGPGIPLEDVEHVFERFFRGSGTRKARGTGLGLAIVGAMARANGGRARAENHPDGGALLTVALPRPAAEAGDA